MHLVPWQLLTSSLFLNIHYGEHKMGIKNEASLHQGWEQ